jgi:hypothetical protein
MACNDDGLNLLKAVVMELKHVKSLNWKISSYRAFPICGLMGKFQA